MTVDKSVLERYLSVLKSYAASLDERHLVSSAELGCELIAADVPAEEIPEIHKRTLARLVEETPDIRLKEAIPSITAPLRELLTAYGLAGLS